MVEAGEVGRWEGRQVAVGRQVLSLALGRQAGSDRGGKRKVGMREGATQP